MIKVSDSHFAMSDDGTWIKKGGKLKMALGTKNISNADLVARDIVKNKRIGKIQKAKLTTKIAQFVSAYDELNTYLHTSKGNVPVSEDSIELKNKWHSYLFNGRELLDELGKVIHISFDLKQNVAGLNKKKIESLKKNVTQAMRKKDGLAPLLEVINEFELTILEFIALRNFEKTNGNSIVEPPMISENGFPSGGSLNDIEKSFSEYYKFSYNSILNLSKKIVG